MNENSMNEGPAYAGNPITPPPLIPVQPKQEPEVPIPSQPGLRDLFEALLRRPHELARVFDGPAFGGILTKLLGIASVSLLVFGFVLGCFSRHEQLWLAPLKVLSGMLFAALICYPSLYVFSTLAGARFSPKSLLLCLTGSLALGGMLLLGLAPALWIFVESTSSFGFIGFLALMAWIVAMFFSLRFIKDCANASGKVNSGPVVVWSALFLLVTLQLSTTLRPLLGRSDQWIQVEEKRFFLEHWMNTAGDSAKNASPEATRSTEINP
ncbi:MAG: hypothetical protein RI957_2139 [Verrucomicrobiota bacterium]|jgi:hypothetical protein